MEFKGTEGKWYVSEAYQTITDEKGFGIAQEHGIKNSLNWEANALLISKAPEMLEMLRACQKVVTNKVIYDEIEQLIKDATEL